MSVTGIAECHSQALKYLARREHSQQELITKLHAKGFSTQDIEPVITQLVAQNLLSNARYAELYAAERMKKGYGPMRIGQELQQRGVSAELVEEVLAVHEKEWVTYATQTWRKYLRLHPGEPLAKQQQFLYYRGFSYEHIREVIKAL